jgi:mono/diheme cytochrome c family protein
VIAGLSRAKPIALWGRIPVICLGLVLVSGCDLNSYSKDMRYPVREDVIVERPNADAPPFPPPGQFVYLLPIFAEKGGKTLDPGKLTSDQRQAFQKTLDDIFGTPAEPTVKGIDPEARSDLKLENGQLAEGSRLYRRHCLHCHGLTGDGHGPTAAWVNPHPRDYRAGRFKFISTTVGSSKAKRQDLLRTLRQGLEGTSMPSFGLLPSEELEALVSYVIHLSLRGQIELIVMTEVLKGDVKETGEIVSRLKEERENIVKDWLEVYSEEKQIPFGAYAVKEDKRAHDESIARGYKLFLGQVKDAPGCISCHLDYGRQNAYKFDDWGTIVRPRDLTAGVYRGGRRPIDLYWRIRGGIKAGAMPESPVTPAQAWDLVNFVRALPYPAMLPENARLPDGSRIDIRHKVYPLNPPKENRDHHAAVRED